MNTNLHSSIQNTAFVAELNQMIEYNKELLVNHMKALNYAEKMAEEEWNKPVDNENPREKIWFEKADKMRMNALRLVEKRVKLIEKLLKQTNNLADALTPPPSDEPTTPPLETNPQTSSPLSTKKTKQEIFESLLKRREVYRDPSVPADQVWLGLDEDTPADQLQAPQKARGGKVAVDSDLDVANLLNNRNIYYCSSLKPGEIWVGME